jgi:hypothetical protein
MHDGMTNIMLSTDELMTLYRAVERAMKVAAEEARAKGKEPESSQEYKRIGSLLEKIKHVT